MNDMPIKVVNGATVYMRDVAQVRDGYSVQTSIVRTNGTRGALLTVMRNGKASTLAVVNNVKQRLPQILAGLTSGAQGARSCSTSRCSCGRPSTAWCGKPPLPPFSPA